MVRQIIFAHLGETRFEAYVLVYFLYHTVWSFWRIHPSKMRQKENKNQQSTITITKQHSHIKLCLFFCFFLTYFLRHGYFHIFSHLAVNLFSLLGLRSYWSWSSATKFIEIEYPDIISFRHLISILHHFEEWIAKGIKW